MNRKLVFLASFLIASLAQATTIKIATVAPDGTAWMHEMRASAESIKKRTDGRVEIKYYPGGVMGDEPTVLRKIKIGQLQGGAFTGGELSQVNKDAQIYSLPFLFHSQDEVDHVRAALDAKLKASFNKVGFEAVAICGGGFAYVMSVQDIKTKEQLKAAKVWVPQGDHIAEIGFTAAGVTPIPLPLADVYTSLQTGLIDTVANTPAGAIAFQWHTKLKHMIDVPITYIVGTLIVDKKVFETLSLEDQKSVNEEMTAAFARLDALSRNDNLSAREALRKQGIAIFVPNAEEEKSWQALGETITKQFSQEQAVSVELINEMQKMLQELRSDKVHK